MWMPSYRKFKETLTAMCRMTTPNGFEPYVWPHLPSPPKGGAPGSNRSYKDGSTQIDANGNYVVRIPGPGDRVLWASHCDTADSEPKLVNMKWHNETLKTDGKSILGADDKVGCTIMAMMIRAGCPGTYVFFQGEEVGCLGSSEFAKEVSLLDYDACISLDRRGYDSVITRQRGSRCCSDDWAAQLGSLIRDESMGAIDMRPDPTGVFTDSAEFTDLIPECTNLSVGYFAQHSHAEKADVSFAYMLCCALIRITAPNKIPLPIRDIINSTDDYEYGYPRNLRWYRSEYEGLTDPDFLTDNDWKDWKDAL